MRTYLSLPLSILLVFGSLAGAGEKKPRPVLTITAPTTVQVAAKLTTFTGLEEQALPAKCNDVDAKDWEPRARQDVIQPNGKKIRYNVYVEVGYSHFSDVYLTCLSQKDGMYYYPARAICEKPNDFVYRMPLTFKGQKGMYFVCSSEPSSLAKLSIPAPEAASAAPPLEAVPLIHAIGPRDLSTPTD